MSQPDLETLRAQASRRIKDDVLEILGDFMGNGSHADLEKFAEEISTDMLKGMITGEVPREVFIGQLNVLGAIYNVRASRAAWDMAGKVIHMILKTAAQALVSAIL